MNEVREEGISLLDILVKVKKHILFIIISIVSCVGVMGVYSLAIQKPQYMASSSLIINSKYDGTQAVSYAQSIIPTFQDYIVSDIVRERALEIANIEEGTEYAISTNNEQSKLIVEITITSYDPVVSVELAKAFAEASKEVVKENPDGALKVLGMAEPGILKEAKSASVSRPVVKNCVIGAAVGVVIACAYVFIRMLIENTFTKPEEIERELGVPVLAVTPYINYEELDEKGKPIKKNRK